MSYTINSLKGQIGGVILNHLIGIFIILILTLIFTLYIGYRKPEDRIDSYYPEHTRSFYINDYSHVLTFETEKYILDEATRLEKITSSKLVTVMIPETINHHVDTYSKRLAEEWGVEQNNNDDNNALILFTTTTPSSWVNFGKGIINGVEKEYFQKTKNILANTANDDQNNRCWNRAARNTFTTIAIMLYNKAGEKIPNTLIMLDQNLHCPDFANAEGATNTTSVTFADGDYETPTAAPNNSIFMYEKWTEFVGLWLFFFVLALINFGLVKQKLLPSDYSLNFCEYFRELKEGYISSRNARRGITTEDSDTNKQKKKKKNKHKNYKNTEKHGNYDNNNNRGNHGKYGNNR